MFTSPFSMSYKVFAFLLLLIAAGIPSRAQKPFAEGTIVYNVAIRSADHKEVTGVYTFLIKGAEIRKELKLSNGYEDVVILNCLTGKVYSLQARGNKKYAIQLNMDEMQKKQEKFSGYAIKNETMNNRLIAGYASYKGNINYKDGTNEAIVYTKDWSPSQAITFERFPDAKFLPTNFSYKDENNMVMQFDIDKIEQGPIESAMFRIPADYHMISYAEYKQLSR
ncbi:MAG: hypothetical protein JWQ38_70 [Flavipsychrobacter sp.]|nr:hypothetical protein [Flavipsychrobacter sp.]